jgi:hypothetical protein
MLSLKAGAAEEFRTDHREEGERELLHSAITPLAALLT